LVKYSIGKGISLSLSIICPTPYNYVFFSSTLPTLLSHIFIVFISMNWAEAILLAQQY